MLGAGELIWNWETGRESEHRSCHWCLLLEMYDVLSVICDLVHGPSHFKNCKAVCRERGEHSWHTVPLCSLWFLDEKMASADHTGDSVTVISPVWASQQGGQVSGISDHPLASVTLTSACVLTRMASSNCSCCSWSGEGHLAAWSVRQLDAGPGSLTCVRPA